MKLKHRYVYAFKSSNSLPLLTTVNHLLVIWVVKVNGHAAKSLEKPYFAMYSTTVKIKILSRHNTNTISKINGYTIGEQNTTISFVCRMCALCCCKCMCLTNPQREEMVSLMCEHQVRRSLSLQKWIYQNSVHVFHFCRTTQIHD